MDIFEKVALLAEGVDRNTLTCEGSSMEPKVALLAEGVDRNAYITINDKKYKSRPPRGGRG